MTFKAVPWWKDAVIYEIYSRSFQDSNGDGIGDLPGIIQRLPYLEDLGIDAIWLTPIYPSPQSDNGYDISDYCNIDPMFGTLEDMEHLIAEAKKRNIRVILDLVLNHTSDQHPWFIEARKGKENPYHDYYVWRDGTPDVLPNDMRACFSGPAWTWVPEVQQYYLHQFSRQQPDLNWDNPKVRQELYQIINFWIEKGVGGFRLDVIDQIAKVPELKITHNGPNLHNYIREMNRHTFGSSDLVTVGETWGATPEIAQLFSSPSGDEFSMVFQFEHIDLDQIPGKLKWDLQPLNLTDLKRVLSKWQTALHNTGWNSLFWDNHDLPRIVSRWGNDGQYRVPSAKMLATLLYGMQGTPYIYQGEELGMTNIQLDIEECQDIETLNLYRERLAAGYTPEEIMSSIHAKGRDNARTPMQWNATSHAGFTTGTPWMKVNPNYLFIHAQNQVSDSSSIFSYYKQLIQLRKQHSVFREGKYTLLLENHPEIFAYRRHTGEEELCVVCNFYGNTVEIPDDLHLDDMVLLIGNYGLSEQSKHLKPYEARIYRRMV